MTEGTKPQLKRGFFLYECPESASRWTYNEKWVGGASSVMCCSERHPIDVSVAEI